MLTLTRWIARIFLKTKMEEEKIICSAIWFDDDIARANQNVFSGFVVAGLRHSDCYRTASVFDPEYKYNYRSKQGVLNFWKSICGQKGGSFNCHISKTGEEKGAP